MPDRRSYQTEIMDQFDLGGPEMEQTLKELRHIGDLLGGHQVTINGLEALLREKPLDGRAVSIADLGCGGGDTLRKIADWARKKKIPIRLTGFDANAYIVDYARERSKDYPEIEYRQMDVFSYAFKKESFDIIHCGLFCHHFVDGDLIYLFRQLNRQAKLGVLINDLHRHWFAYHSIRIITKLFSRSPMVKNDAPLSVARSFRRAELEAMLYKAGLPAYTLKWMWAWRWQVMF